MKRKIEMPEIMKCTAAECAYNHEETCHAKGITVGDMEQQLCDTMWKSSQHTGRTGPAGVGACRSLHCAYNSDLECQADAIDVMLSGGQARCGTFTEG